MPTLQVFPGEMITLTAKNERSYGTFVASATTPAWSIDDHTVVEFVSILPTGHTAQVVALSVGTAIVTAVLDAGTTTFTLDVVAPLVLTKQPVIDYAKQLPLANETQANTAPPLAPEI